MYIIGRKRRGKEPKVAESYVASWGVLPKFFVLTKNSLAFRFQAFLKKTRLASPPGFGTGMAAYSITWRRTDL